MLKKEKKYKSFLTFLDTAGNPELQREISYLLRTESVDVLKDESRWTAGQLDTTSWTPPAGQDQVGGVLLPSLKAFVFLSSFKG